MRKRLIQLLVVILGLGLIVKSSKDILRLFKAGEQIKLVEQRVLQLEKEKKELLEKRQYYSSSDFIEEEARNKLNMAKPGETIVILPPNLEELLGRQKLAEKPELPNWKRWWKLFF